MDVRAVKNDLDEMKQKIDKIYHFLDGNGTPGLKTRIALTEEKVETDRYWIVGIMGSIVAMAGFIIRKNFSEGKS
jgi:hypothetical protein